MFDHFTAIDLLLAFVALVLVPVQSIIGGIRSKDMPRNETWIVRRYWLIIVRATFVSLVLLGAWYLEHRDFTALGLDRPVSFGGQVGFAIDAVIAAYYAYGLLIKRYTPERVADMRRHLDTLKIMPQTSGQLALFELVCITGSIFEELIYRGFLFWFLTGFTGLWGAVVVSSLVFGTGHAYQGVLGMVRTTAIGLAFGIAFALTHSLWWLMLAHIMANAFGGFFSLRMARLAAEPAS